MPPLQMEYSMRAMVPATLEAVEGLFIEFRRCTEGVASRADRFAAELLLREAVTNAMVHGCRGDSARRIWCVLRLKGRRLLIAVRDEGEGFAWRSTQRRDAGLLSSSGRGLEILRKYANRVRFNDRGNAVAMIKLFHERPAHD